MYLSLFPLEKFFFNRSHVGTQKEVFLVSFLFPSCFILGSSDAIHPKHSTPPLPPHLLYVSLILSNIKSDLSNLSFSPFSLLPRRVFGATFPLLLILATFILVALSLQLRKSTQAKAIVRVEFFLRHFRFFFFLFFLSLTIWRFDTFEMLRLQLRVLFPKLPVVMTQCAVVVSQKTKSYI